MRAPLFTRENAAEMARRANAAKAARKAEEAKKLAALPASADECARVKKVMTQIEKIDAMMERVADPDTFVKLTGAKEKLWNLIWAKAGVMKPNSQPRRRQSTSLPEPSPGA